MSDSEDEINPPVKEALEAVLREYAGHEKVRPAISDSEDEDPLLHPDIGTGFHDFLEQSKAIADISGTCLRAIDGGEPGAPSFRTPLATSLYNNAIQCLQQLRDEKDGLAPQVLNCVAGNFRIGPLDLSLEKRVLVARLVGIACTMNPSRPSWEVRCPRLRDHALFVVRGNEGQVAELDSGLAIIWYVAQIDGGGKKCLIAIDLYSIRAVHRSRILKVAEPEVRRLDIRKRFKWEDLVCSAVAPSLLAEVLRDS